MLKKTIFALAVTVFVPAFGSTNVQTDFKVRVGLNAGVVDHSRGDITKRHGVKLPDGRVIKSEKDVDEWILGVSSLSAFCNDLPVISQGMSEHAIGFSENSTLSRLSYLEFVLKSDSQEKKCSVNSTEFEKDCRRLCETPATIKFAFQSYGFWSRSNSETPTGILSLPDGRTFQSVSDIKTWAQSAKSMNEFCEGIPYLKNLIELHLIDSAPEDSPDFAGTVNQIYFNVYKGAEKTECEIFNSEYEKLPSNGIPYCQSFCDSL